jgi:ABC-2 type transport system permease protein
VGLDAMRQLAFVGADFPVGTPPPEVEALILVAMTVVFLAASRWMLRTLERLARKEGRLSVRWQ